MATPTAGGTSGGGGQSAGISWGGVTASTATLLCVLGLWMGVEQFSPAENREATVTLGFLLLAAVFGGKAVAGLGLPAITGYILVGLAVGESLLGLVSQADIGRLGLVDDVAISLIALSAGGELKLSELRERASSMLGIMVSEMGAVFVVVAGAFLALAPWMPFTADLPVREALTIAMIFGAIAIANSPSVAIAVINDSGARGPVSSTILGVTVLKDVAVILLFAVALSVARTLLSPEAAFETGFFVDVGWKLGGSILVGAASGWLVSFALQRSTVSKVLLALGAAFFNAEIAVLLDLEILLLSLTAGFFVENVSPAHGEPFLEGVEANSLPLYALFFSLAGAGIFLADLAALWPVVLAFVALRAGAVFGGTWLGARLTNAEPEVERYAWLGFVSQAGVTLGMVVIAADAFPEWGDQLRTIFVSMVAVHELIGPALMQYGLKRAGETGAREAMAEEPAGA